MQTKLSPSFRDILPIDKVLNTLAERGTDMQDFSSISGGGTPENRKFFS